jgi:LmbE family N-acetylglucosaminyl deacetylase
MIKTKNSKAKKSRRGRPVKKVSLLSRFKTHFSSFTSPYVIFSAAILLLTTLWWATLGALTQSTNADQIINSYLFQGPQTFQSAEFPAAHTFLIKWPLFIIERLFNYSPVVLIILTVLVSVVTVLGLAYILYRIDRRPKVIGTVFLALACILLFIPAQPHAGGLLPVNFAMLTTRNIEYLFYILSLVLIIRTPRFRHKLTYWALALLTLLISSDKLFMWISLGGAVGMLVIYLIARRKPLVKLALRWLGVTIAAVIISTVFIWFINITGLTHIVGDNSPYGLGLTAKQLTLGVIFGFMGLLTNFGANPAFDIGVAKDIPKVFAERLLSPIVIPVLLNLAVFIGGVVAAITIFIKSLKKPQPPKRRKKNPDPEYSVATLLTLTLITSSVVAIGFFVGTNHYYPVDSRYETIVLFALCIAIVTWLRTRPLPKFSVKKVATVLLVGIVIGSIWTFASSQQQSTALSTINDRNAKIAEVILNHKTNVLVGDYWRVIPISQINTKVETPIIPMGDCTTPRATLTSKAWEKDFEHKSFTYLLSLDKSATDYPACSIDQIVQAYGRPNASTLIAGTNEDPKEMLLFYDNGVNDNHSLTGLSKTATIEHPTEAQQTKLLAPCEDGITMMNIVAHEDDDLLFMNPDIQHEIDAKHCVRTVYVTAGDAGNGSQYWLGRERATEAAYESMMGIDTPLVWTQRPVKISDHEFVSIATPNGHRGISLIFMHLPDGNLNGQGYKVSGFESLERLHSGKVSSVQTVDEQSHYSSSDLKTALTALMNFYLPTVINTQASYDAGHMYHDHEDHISVGKYVDSAYPAYVNQSATPLVHYIGYPIREYPANVSDDDLARKTKAFLAYATFDGGVCQSQVMCDQTPTYNAYLQREYPQ